LNIIVLQSYSIQIERPNQTHSLQIHIYLKTRQEMEKRKQESSRQPR